MELVYSNDNGGSEKTTRPLMVYIYDNSISYNTDNTSSSYSNSYVLDITCNPDLVVNWITNNGKSKGFLPNSERRLRDIKKFFKEEYQLECLSYLCMIIVSDKGFRTNKSVSSYTLKTLLGNQYIDMLGVGIRSGLIKVDSIESIYNGKTSKRHWNISVQGQRGSFSYKELRNEITINRVKKYKLRGINHEHHPVLVKTFYSLTRSYFDHPNYKELNTGLRGGFFTPRIDLFGRRCHTVLTRVKRGLRGVVRCIDRPDEKTAEVDLKSSHAYFLFQVVKTPELMEHAIKDKPALESLKIALRQGYNPWMDSEISNTLNKGLFIEDFFIPMLDECFKGWSDYVRNLLLEAGEIKVTDRPSTRSLGKYGFMYVVNGGASKIARSINRNYKYHQFIRVIKAIQSVDLSSTRDVKEVKDYAPYKNTSMILQRIESRFMQEVYLRSLVDYGFLVHDSVVTLQSETWKVSRAIKEVAAFMGLPSPVCKVK